MIISILKHFSTKHKKIFYYLSFFTITFLLSSDVTFAAFEAKDIAEGFSEVLKVLSVFLGLMTYLTTMFLSPEWINGSLFGMTEKFKDVWILVSNVVYFVFAFILIWIAFMNIIGKSGDNYQLKQALPKFIVGVLIVPFSWFLVQFILSISAILTISALSLPSDTFPDYESKLGNVKIPKECTINLTSFSSTGSTDETKKPDETKSTSFIDCPKKNTVTLSTILNGGDSTSSIYGLISTYTFSIISFDTIGNIDKFNAKSINNLSDLVVKIVFDFLFIIVYSILMITLGIVLMIRGIYIWIYIMLSPIFGLMYFFGKAEGGEGFFAKFNLKEFIALAMVPVYTMLALSFGLLFMYVVGSGLSTNTTSKTVGGNTVTVDSSDDGKTSSINIGKDEKNSFKLNFVGPLSNPDGSANSFLKEIGGGTLGVVGALILKLFGIVVLWGTLLAAMRTSEITKAITEPIYDFGTKVGGIVSSAPGNIPIFGGQSMKSMGTIASGVEGKISQMNTDRGNKFLDKTPFGNNTLNKSMNDLQSEIIKATSPNQKADLMQKIITNADGDFKQMYTNSAAQKALFDLVSSIDPAILKDLKIDKPININNGEIVAKIYEKVEAKGLQYKNILPENEGQINEAAMIKAAKTLKNKGTTTSSGQDNNKIDSQTSTVDGRILNVTLNNQKVHFNEGGKIKDGSFDEFASSVNGLSFDNAKELYNSQGIKNFDEIFKDAQDSLGKEVLDKDDKGNIKIDLSKKK